MRDYFDGEQELWQKNLEHLAAPSNASQQQPSSSSSPSSSLKYSLATQDADIIILAIGAWEEGQKFQCAKHANNATIEEQVERGLDAMESYQQLTNKTIIVRSSGFFDIGVNRSDDQFVRKMNKLTMDKVDAFRHNDKRPLGHPKLTYVDWGTAVEPRSFGANRVQGDHVAHYGLECRLVALQMMTNHLMYDRNYF
jgi:hypothetical protein